MITTLVFATAISTALVAGIFFAFSTFVMAGLGRIPAEQGIAAMNSINITVINPWFLGAFMGTGALCLIAGIMALPRLNQPEAWLIIVASLLYLVGCIGVTMAFNVPLNNALAGATPGTPAAATLWATYLDVWVKWNHVRTIAPLLSSALMIGALMKAR